MHKSSILTASSTWPKTSVSLSTNPKPRSYSRQRPLPRTRQSHHHNHLINHSSSPPITLLLYSWNWSRIDDCNSFLYNNILNERQYIQNSPTPLPVTSQKPSYLTDLLHHHTLTPLMQQSFLHLIPESCNNSLQLNLLQGFTPIDHSDPVHPRGAGWGWGQGSVHPSHVLPHQTGTKHFFLEPSLCSGTNYRVETWKHRHQVHPKLSIICNIISFSIKAPDQYCPHNVYCLYKLFTRYIK